MRSATVAHSNIHWPSNDSSTQLSQTLLRSLGIDPSDPKAKKLIAEHGDTLVQTLTGTNAPLMLREGPDGVVTVEKTHGMDGQENDNPLPERFGALAMALVDLAPAKVHALLFQARSCSGHPLNMMVVQDAWRLTISAINTSRPNPGTTTATTTTTNTTATTITAGVTQTDIHAPGTTTAALPSAERLDADATDTTTSSDGSNAPEDDDALTPRSGGLWDMRPFAARQTFQDKAVQQAYLEGVQAIAKAIYANDPSKLQAAFKLAPLLNEPVQGDTTPLRLAACVAAHKVIAFLLKDPKIEVNRAGKDGWAALHLAVKTGDARTVALLLKNPSIRVNITLSSGATPYLVALQHGHVKVAQLLLDNGAKTDLTMRNGFMPLHVACQAGSLSTVKWLLKQPATLQRHGEPQTLAIVLNQATREGWTPLLLAAQDGNEALFTFLLMHPLVKPALVNIDGNGPLHLAVTGGHLRIAERLIKSDRADIALANHDGATPFFLAIQYSPKVLPRLLLPHLAEDGIHQPTKSGLRPLHAACMNGDVETFHWLLEQPGTRLRNGKPLKIHTVLNEVTQDGKTHLHLAVEAKKRRMVADLLSNGVLPNLADEVGDTPLHVAVRVEDRFLAAMLLEHPDIEVNCVNQAGMRPIALAIDNGNLLMEQVLMASGADINHTDKNGVTALHEACADQNLQLAQRLLQRPALLLLHGKARTMAEALNQRDDHGYSLLLHAMNNGEDAEAVVTFLLKQPGIDVNLADSADQTPLHMASSMGLTGTVRMLMSKGADIERRDVNGETPLHQASDYGRLQVVKLLLDQLAMPMANGHMRDMTRVLNQATRQGETPLHFAAKRRHKEIVKFLLGHAEVNPNLRSSDGKTALHLAVEVEELDIVILLARRGGMALNARTATGATPLHLAISLRLYDIVDTLLEFGAHINGLDAKGFTPLHTACGKGDLEGVRSLIQRPQIRLLNGTPRNFSAVLSQVTTAGETPLFLAVQSGNVEVVLYLLPDSANPNLMAADGMTPLHEATRRGNLAVVTALLGHPKINVFSKGPGGNTMLHFIGRSEQAKHLIEAYQKAMGPDAFRKLADVRNVRGHKALAVAPNTNAQDAAMLPQQARQLSNSSSKPPPNA